jgi:hypothetical protein
MPLPKGSYGLRKTAGARVLKRKPGRKPSTTPKAPRRSSGRLTGTIEKIQDSLAHLEASDRAVLRETAHALAILSEDKKRILRRGVKRSIKKAGLSKKPSGAAKRPLSAFFRFAQDPKYRAEAREAIVKRGEEPTLGQLAKELGKMYRERKGAYEAGEEESLAPRRPSPPMEE